MENAREILRTKAGKKGGYYQDAKYVKMACGTAYNAVLLALEAYLEMKGKKSKQKNRVNVDDFRRALIDDRNLNLKIIAPGMESADAIIKAIRPHYLN